MRDAGNEVSQYVDVDVRFHLAIADAAHNDVLAGVLPSLQIPGLAPLFPLAQTRFGVAQRREVGHCLGLDEFGRALQVVARQLQDPRLVVHDDKGHEKGYTVSRRARLRPGIVEGGHVDAGTLHSLRAYEEAALLHALRAPGELDTCRNVARAKDSPARARSENTAYRG